MMGDDDNDEVRKRGEMNKERKEMIIHIVWERIEKRDEIKYDTANFLRIETWSLSKRSVSCD